VVCSSEGHVGSGIKYLVYVDEASFASCLENSFKFGHWLV
jgi:hypothetical protein